MIIPETFVPCSGHWIRFDKNTYSFCTMHSDNINIKDHYLLTNHRTYFSKLNFYDHVKCTFPDKYLYQQIY